MTPDDLLTAAEQEEQRTEDLLSVKEYAQLAGVHLQTVYTAIRTDRLRYGRVVRITDDIIRIAVPRKSA